MATGSACPADKSRVMSSSPSNLIAAGVKKETSVNQAPDWGLIIGGLCHVTLAPLFIGCLKAKVKFIKLHHFKLERFNFIVNCNRRMTRCQIAISNCVTSITGMRLSAIYMTHVFFHVWNLATIFQSVSYLYY